MFKTVQKYFLLVVFIFYSCNSANQKDNQSLSSSSGNEGNPNELSQFKMNYIISNIPSPVILVNDLLDSGLPFQKDLMLPVSVLNSLGTSDKSALCMGVFGADLCYATIYEQTQEAINYMQVVKQLADYLGISSIVGEPTMGKFQKNINNSDSLITIVFAMYDSMDKYLRDNDRVSNAAFVLTGGWVEVFYLTTHLAINADHSKNKILYERIYEHKLHLENVLSLLNDFKSFPEFEELINQLQAIHSLFQNLQTPNQVSPEELELMKVKITDIRNELIA